MVRYSEPASAAVPVAISPPGLCYTGGHEPGLACLRWRQGVGAVGDPGIVREGSD